MLYHHSREVYEGPRSTTKLWQPKRKIGSIAREPIDEEDGDGGAAEGRSPRSLSDGERGNSKVAQASSSEDDRRATSVGSLN